MNDFRRPNSPVWNHAAAVAVQLYLNRKQYFFLQFLCSEVFAEFTVPVCSMLLCSSEVRSVDADPDPALIRTPTILIYK